jgi:cytoskeletal protein CcmA (bactofilin family)
MADGDGKPGNLSTIIGEDVELTGTVKCNDSIQINGKLNGDLNCSGDAIIGEKANVQGNLTVNGVSVMGQVNGNIVAKDKIELKSSARVNGDIKSKRLTVVDGVTFIGKSEVNPSGAPAGVAAKSDGNGKSAGGGGEDESAAAEKKGLALGRK